MVRKKKSESAIDWAVRRTDIALWCSSSLFDAPMNKRVWSRVPDSLKDHAFLVLTKADELSAAKGPVLPRDRIWNRSSRKSFIRFSRLRRFKRLQANSSTSQVDEAMRSMPRGGGALTSEILRHAERGRRADFDSGTHVPNAISGQS